MTESTQPKLPVSVRSAEWAGPDSIATELSGLIHYVRLPKNAEMTRRVPLVILSHGWAGDETAMWIFARLIPSGTAIVAPRAPRELPHYGGYFWFDYNPYQRTAEPESLTEAVTALRRFVQSMPELYPVDPQRVVLVGFSQGAMVGNALAMTQPQLIHGVASLAGATVNLPPSLPPVDSLAGLPVFIAHGTKDEMVPLAAAQEARDWFVRLGANVTYGEYSTGHKMNSAAMRDLQQWFAQVIGESLSHNTQHGGSQ